MREPQSVESIDRRPITPKAADAHLRAIGSPLRMGSGGRSPASSAEGGGNRIPVGLGRALPGPASPDERSGLARAVGAVRAVLPVVQRLLPLLDGNVATAIAGLFAPHPHPAPPPPKVDLAPLETGLTELQSQQRNLRDQVMEQGNSLKRVEDQLALVREATDRNTLEQQELLEDLRTFGKKVRVGVIVSAVIVTCLLAASLFLNVMLFLHLKNVLP